MQGFNGETEGRKHLAVIDMDGNTILKRIP
jgi:hypothetical protein